MPFSFEQYAHLTWNDGIQLAKGVGVTLSITLISIVLGSLLGTVLGVIRCSKNKIISSLPLIFTEPLRNSPLIVQLFLVYYGLPLAMGVLMDAYPAAILTLSLNTAAFFTVLVHNSIEAIPKSQWEAAYALGHNIWSASCYIIFRQVLRLLIPQAVTLYIGQLQCTSMVSLISLGDLTKIGETIIARTFMPFVVWGIVFAIYYAISYPLSRLASNLEHRVGYSY
jgi:His/Glu/Gln/Arg/opine family amino acid ABC transporter permease subunit